MRILYGVTGEGLGHAMRSRVIAADLSARGHEVKLVASGRAWQYLGRYFDDVQEIPGFTLAYARGGIGRLRTAVKIRRVARNAIRETIDLYEEKRPIDLGCLWFHPHLAMRLAHAHSLERR